MELILNQGKTLQEISTLKDICDFQCSESDKEDHKQFSESELDDNLKVVLNRPKGKKTLQKVVKKDKQHQLRRFTAYMLYYNQQGKFCAKTLKVGRNIIKAAQMNNQTYKANRKMYKKILFSSPDFDLAVVEANGGFLNPHLWDINIAYFGESRNELTVKELICELNEQVKVLQERQKFVQ